MKTRDGLGQEKEREYMKKIEAALFISGRWLSLKDLITLTDINPILIRQLVEKLIKKYSGDTALQILSGKDRWKMDVKLGYEDMVNKLATGSSEFSKAEQETLAVIAYKQPIKQSVVIKIRGNKAYDHIKKFIECGLVKGKKSGRTKELTLSEDFHNYFKLGKRDEANKD